MLEAPTSIACLMTREPTQRSKDRRVARFDMSVWTDLIGDAPLQAAVAVAGKAKIAVTALTRSLAWRRPFEVIEGVGARVSARMPGRRHWPYGFAARRSLVVLCQFFRWRRNRRINDRGLIGHFGWIDFGGNFIAERCDDLTRVLNGRLLIDRGKCNLIALVHFVGGEFAEQ
jgi:hypothetical protein